ncbi:MAG: NfeD family protein [Leptonema sp. (in: bacteria)]
MNSTFWYILGILLIVSEIFLPGMIVIFFGISAIFVGILSSLLLLTSISSQFLSWAIFSILLIVFLRGFFKKMFPSLEIKQQVKDTLVGKSAIVIEEINPLKGTGRVELGGTTWKAISINGEIISINKKVLVENQENLTLFVKEIV